MERSLKWNKIGILAAIHLNGTSRLSELLLYCAGLSKRDQPTSMGIIAILVKRAEF